MPSLTPALGLTSRFGIGTRRRRIILRLTEIRAIGFAGRSFAKPKPASSYFLSWGERIKGEGEHKTQIEFPHFLPSRHFDFVGVEVTRTGLISDFGFRILKWDSSPAFAPLWRGKRRLLRFWSARTCGRSPHRRQRGKPWERWRPAGDWSSLRHATSRRDAGAPRMWKIRTKAGNQTPSHLLPDRNFC